MVALILVAIISVIIIYYVRKYNKKPTEMGNIPSMSGIPIMWAFLQGKDYEEIADIIHKTGHDIYMVYISNSKNLLYILSNQIFLFTLPLFRHTSAHLQ
jgi:hypothetical protein